MPEKSKTISKLDAILLALLGLTFCILLFTGNRTPFFLMVFFGLLRLIILLKRKLFYKIKYRLIISSLFFIITPIVLITIFFYLALNIIIMQYNLAIFDNITVSDLEAFERSCDYYLALNDESRINFELNRWKTRRPLFFNVIVWRKNGTDNRVVFNYPEFSPAKIERLCPRIFSFSKGYFKAFGNIYLGVFKSNPDFAIIVFQTINQTYFEYLPKIGDFSLKFVPPEQKMTKPGQQRGLNFQIEENLDDEMFLSYRFPLPYFYKYLDYDIDKPVEKNGVFFIVNNISKVMQKLKITDYRKTLEKELEMHRKSLSHATTPEQKEKISGSIVRVEDEIASIDKQDLSSNNTNLQRFLFFLIILFALFMLVSLFIGYRMVRVITVAVDELMKGTDKVLKGDFSYRIKLKSRDQFYTLANSFNEMSAGIEKLLIDEKEKQRLEEELRIARTVQMKLLPKETFDCPDFELAAVNIPAKEIAGDYFDYFYNKRKQFLILVADVAGKGAPAAFYMAELKGIISYLQQEDFSPRDIIYHSHQSLAASFEKVTFITVNLAKFLVAENKLVFARSGHTPAIFYDSGTGKCQELTPKGIAIGLHSFSKELVEEVTLSYKPGDIVCFFSDGLSEITNSEEEMFGTERLKKIIIANSDRTTQEIKEKILKEVFEFSNNRSPIDDLTFLIVKVK